MPLPTQENRREPVNCQSSPTNCSLEGGERERGKESCFMMASSSIIFFHFPRGGRGGGKRKENFFMMSLSSVIVVLSGGGDGGRGIGTVSCYSYLGEGIMCQLQRTPKSQA